jgi:ABC-type molybdate transport system substrate-binding protein
MRKRQRFASWSSAAALALSLWACGSASAPTTPTPVPTPTPTPTVASIAVTGTTPEIEGASQFTATATLSDGTKQDVTLKAAWQSSNTSVAAVSTGGIVAVIAAGDADITATYQSVTGKMHLAVH